MGRMPALREAQLLDRPARLRGHRPTGDAWAETQLVLPPTLAGRRLRDALTGLTLPDPGTRGAPDVLELPAVFHTLPVALLEMVP